MRNYKIVHIHSDVKFIYEIENYKFTNVRNTVLFLGDENSLLETYNKQCIVLAPKEENIPQILAHCHDADLIVLNYLSFNLQKLILKFPSDIKILWRFFGGEIYLRETKLVYSERTITERSRTNKHKSLESKIKTYIYKKIFYKDPFELAVKRVNFFGGVIDDEYVFLTSIGYKLPNFVQIPLNLSLPEMKSQKKTHTIIFGNSRNKGNNHLDILHLMDNRSFSNETKIKMFFSYGPEDKYTEEVRNQAKKISQIEIIENFLTKPEFIETYETAAAFIFNGFRQMALGNVFTAINCGVKVYLSERNIVYSWLSKNKIKVFSIENELSEDLENNNIFLTEKIAFQNQKNVEFLYKKHNIQNFHKTLKQILN